MDNNDILRRLRYALDLKNSTMVKIFKLAGKTFDEAAILRLLKKEEDEDCQPCTNDIMVAFLDSLIVYKRGPSDKKNIIDNTTLTNNMILKKIRIALTLKEDDMMEIFKQAEFKITKYELNALFRKEGQKNYKACGDQFLRNFLIGLTEYYRPASPEQ